MKKFDELLQDLKSSDASVRDHAALDLVEIGNDEAVPHLIEAIRSPETVNHRGTLVFSLSDFDCSDYLNDLVDLCLTGNFEVSSNAYNIIDDFNITKHMASQIRGLLEKYSIDKLPYEHGLEAYKALFQLIE